MKYYFLFVVGLDWILLCVLMTTSNSNLYLTCSHASRCFTLFVSVITAKKMSNILDVHVLASREAGGEE